MAWRWPALPATNPDQSNGRCPHGRRYETRGHLCHAKKEYDLRFRDAAGNPKPPVRVVVDPADEETLRAHLIELAAKHDFRQCDRVEEWIGDYALEVCVPGHRRPELVFKAMK